MNVRDGGPLPLLALLWAATFWGLIWYPARWLESQGLAGPWQTLVSYAAALAVLWLARGMDWRAARAAGRPALALMAAAGWTNVAFVLAIIGDAVVRVMILFYLSPLWAVLLGRWLLGERIRPLTWGALLLGLVGAVVMLYRPDLLRAPLSGGDALALSAGLAFALTNVLTRRLRGMSDTLKTQLSWSGVVLISAAVLAVAAIPPPQAPASAWLGALALGVPGFLVSTLAVVYAVSRMPVQRSSVILLFEIVVGALSAWWLAEEALGWREALGGGMIVCAGLMALSIDERKVSAP